MGRIKKYLLLFKILSIFALAYTVKWNKKLKETAKWINRGMNIIEEPCNDFYEYVCGKWGTDENEKDPMPEDSNQLAILKIVKLAKGILEKGNDICMVKKWYQTRRKKWTIDNAENKQKLCMEKKWYRACISSSAAEGLKLMQEIVKKSTTTDPTDSQETDKRCQNVAKFYAGLFGESVFFDFELSDDNKLTFNRPLKKYMNSKKFEHLEHIDSEIQDLFKYFIPEEESDIQTVSEETKKELKKFIKSVNELVRETSDEKNIVTIELLKEKYDNTSPNKDKAKINWYELFLSILTGTETVLRDSDEIAINFHFFDKLTSILEETPTSAILNYIHLNYITDTYNYWSSLINQIDSNEKSHHCIMEMPIIDGYSSKIMKKYISKKSKQHVINMFQVLQQEENLEMDDSWLPKKLKDKIQRKMRRIEMYLDKLVYYFQPTLKYITSYNFNISSSALDNFINFKKAQTIYMVETSQNQDKKERRKRGIYLNGVYRSKLYIVDIMAGELLSPLFNMKLITMNYGFLGFLIAHEISHAVDYTRSKEMFQDSTPSYAIKMFNERIKCFVKQAESYGTNGKTTLNENIADSMGIKIAFKAFNQIVDRKDIKNEKLPGLEHLNAKQLFFVSFAASYCTSIKNDYKEGDTHMPNHVRINRILSNFNEFVVTFGCTAQNSVMNREKKCDFWARNPPK